MRSGMQPLEITMELNQLCMSSGRSFLRGYKAWVAPQTNGEKKDIHIVADVVDVDVVEDIEAIVDDFITDY